MSIEEELHASWGKHAIEDGIEAGELYTKEQYEDVKDQYEEVKDQRISDICMIVLKLTQSGMPMDEVIDDYVPADIRAEVRQRFSEK